MFFSPTLVQEIGLVMWIMRGKEATQKSGGEVRPNLGGSVLDELYWRRRQFDVKEGGRQGRERERERERDVRGY